MNPAQRKLQSIGAQLMALPVTARMLIIALMVILAMSLFLVAQIAGRPSMVPLPLSLDGDNRTAVLAHLEQTGTPYQESGGRVLVPVERMHTVLAQLTSSKVVGATDFDWSTIMEDASPFHTQEQNRRRWMVTKMRILSGLIGDFSGIESATVVFDEPTGVGFGRTRVAATASVMVVPRGEGLSPSTIDAIANLVAGAVPGMKAHDVQIIDARNHTSHAARNEEDLGVSNHGVVTQGAQRRLKASIEVFLAHIAGVKVAVNVMLDTRWVETRRDDYAEPKIAPVESDRRLFTSQTQSGGLEPGVRPNAIAQISAGGAGATQFSDESSRDVTESRYGVDQKHITDKKGNAYKINVSILVPRLYFIALYRLDTNDAEAVPDTATLDQLVTIETAKIKASVEPLVDTAPYPGALAGEVFVDMMGVMLATVGTPTGLAAPAGVGGASTGSVVGGAFDGSLLKYLLLTGLSLLSLAMMFMMVRKASTQAQLPTPEEIVGVPPTLPTDQSEVVGEAEESAPAMEGLELDEAALQQKQMLGQISNMVKQNPDEVANLLRRWIRVEA